MDYLAGIVDEGMSKMAEIVDEGVGIMADKVNVFTSGDYMTWATKLTSESITYGTELTTKYMTGAMGSIFS